MNTRLGLTKNPMPELCRQLARYSVDNLLKYVDNFVDNLGAIHKVINNDI